MALKNTNRARTENRKTQLCFQRNDVGETISNRSTVHVEQNNENVWIT